MPGAARRIEPERQFHHPVPETGRLVVAGREHGGDPIPVGGGIEKDRGDDGGAGREGPGEVVGGVLHKRDGLIS